MFSRVNLLQDSAFADALVDHPLVAVDIGARGGFEADLLPLAFAVEAVGFEPEPTAFAALTDRGPWRSLRYLPVAISGQTGPRTLHITRDNQSTTLFEPDPDAIAEFDKPQFVTVDRKVIVHTETLEQALAQAGISQLDYLKLDIEGPELEVLQACSRLVDRMLVLKVEVAFLPIRRGQPLAGDINHYLTERGFDLMDFIRPAHWRRDGYAIHPQIGDGRIPYSRGQLIQGDYLFFRKPATLSEPSRALRAAALAMAHGYFDHAATLLRRPDVTGWLAKRYGVDVEAALRAASRRFGRYAWAEGAWRQLRGLTPFARSLVRLLRR